MKGLKWFVLGVAVLVLVAGPVALAEEAKEKAPAKEKAAAKEKPAKDALRGEYAIMVSECKLTDQQQADLKAKIKARDTALEEWTKANGDKLKAADEAAKKAREAKDKDAIKKTGDELKTLQTERTKITDQFETDVQAILTAEQKAAWAGFRVYRAAMMRYKKVNPSEEQTAKIKAACDQAAKEIGEVKADEKAAAKAKNEIQAKLQKNIEETILTAEQREALAKKPPAAEKKPAKTEETPAKADEKPAATK